MQQIELFIMFIQLIIFELPQKPTNEELICSQALIHIPINKSFSKSTKIYMFLGRLVISNSS